MTLTNLEKQLVKTMKKYEVRPPEFKKNWSEVAIKKIVAKRKLLEAMNKVTTDTRIYFIHKIQRNLIGISNEGFYTETYNNESIGNLDFGEVFTGHWIEINSGMESSKEIYKFMPK